jgi:hypothetical protein
VSIRKVIVAVGIPSKPRVINEGGKVDGGTLIEQRIVLDDDSMADIDTYTLPPPNHTRPKKCGALLCRKPRHRKRIIGEEFVELWNKLLKLTESEE